MSRPRAYLQSDCGCRVRCRKCPRLGLTHEDDGSTLIRCICEDPCRLHIRFYPCDPDQSDQSSEESDESSDESEASGNDLHDQPHRPRPTPNSRNPSTHGGRSRDRRGTPPNVGPRGFAGPSKSQAESLGAKDRGDAFHRAFPVANDPLPGPSNKRRPYRSAPPNSLEEAEEAESSERDTGRKRRRNKGKRRGNRSESAKSKKPNMQGR